MDVQGVCYECKAHVDTSSMRQWQYWRGVYVWLCASCSASVHTDHTWNTATDTSIRKGIAVNSSTFCVEPAQGTMRLAFRLWPVNGQRVPYYVAQCQGDGGADWGYVTDLAQATLLNFYWQQRFVADCRRVGEEARLIHYITL